LFIISIETRNLFRIRPTHFMPLREDFRNLEVHTAFSSKRITVGAFVLFFREATHVP